MTEIEKKVSAALLDCSEALSALTEKAQIYLDAHDAYLERNTRDSSLIKRRIVERIERVYDED